MPEINKIIIKKVMPTCCCACSLKFSHSPLSFSACIFFKVAIYCRSNYVCLRGGVTAEFIVYLIKFCQILGMKCNVSKLDYFYESK